MPSGKDINGLRLSPEDADFFSLTLYVGKNGYAVFSKTVKGVKIKKYLHSMVAERVWGRSGRKDQTEIVEHRDRDKLNCTRTNLRLVPQRVNIFNSSVYDKPYGVTWNKHRNKWRTRVTMNGKTHYLGNYFDKTDAQKVVDDFIASEEYQTWISGNSKTDTE